MSGKCPVNSVACKACTPPLFGNFGKDAKDLFKKKYDFENQAKLVSKTSNGGTIETSVIASNDQSLRGVFKSSVAIQKLGRANGILESEFHTVADKESKMTYKSDLGFGKGTSVKVGLSGLKCKEQCAGGFKEGWASAEAEYSTENAAGTLGVRTDGQLTLVDAGVSLGYDCLSVGGKVTVDTASKSAPNDYNFGVQYCGCDYVASAYTENKRSVLNVSIYQRLANKLNFGALLAIGLTKQSRTLTVGTDHRVDADTSIRGQVKIDSTAGNTQLQASVEHRLPNPNVLLAVAADFNVTPQTVTPGRVGVSVTFGEF